MSQSVEAVAFNGWRELLDREDLGWDPGSIDNRSEALHFLARFEGCFCLYSRSEEVLYTQYRFVLPDEAEQSVMILLPV